MTAKEIFLGKGTLDEVEASVIVRKLISSRLGRKFIVVGLAPVLV